MEKHLEEVRAKDEQIFELQKSLKQERNKYELMSLKCRDALIRVKRMEKAYGIDLTTPGSKDSIIEQLIENVKRLEADNICDACMGTGKVISNAEQCMCGGSGKMSDAAIYLRGELFKYERPELFNNEGRLKR